MPADRRLPRELELKLELAPESARRIRRHPLLSRLECETASLEAIYFDTPDHRLRENGYSLRVRRSGNEFVQTLKQGADSAGLFDRNEWESSVGALELDPTALQGAPLRGKGKLLQRLEPVARSSIERSTWLFKRGHSRIEIALDEGCIKAGERKLPVVELELELMKGKPAHLFKLAKDLGNAAPFRIGVLTKSERAYRLARGEWEKSQKASKIELDPNSNVAQAFSTIVSSCLQHFRLNEPLVIDRCDAAALHQTRVAMRRLRAALSLFGTVIQDSDFARLRDELRWLTSCLGDARNVDVFLKRYEGDLSTRDRGKLIAARKQAYRVANDSIDSDRSRELLLGFVQWVETGDWRSGRKARATVKPFAMKRLDRLWAKLSNAGPKLASLDEKQRHRFRIQVKKARYAIEFLGSLFDRSKARSFTKCLEAMQEGLGDLNDQVTARQIASELSLDLDPCDQVEREDRLTETLKVYSRLQRIGPFWSDEGAWLIRRI